MLNQIEQENRELTDVTTRLKSQLQGAIDENKQMAVAMKELTASIQLGGEELLQYQKSGSGELTELRGQYDELQQKLKHRDGELVKVLDQLRAESKTAEEEALVISSLKDDLTHKDDQLSALEQQLNELSEQFAELSALKEESVVKDGQIQELTEQLRIERLESAQAQSEDQPLKSDTEGADDSAGSYETDLVSPRLDTDGDEEIQVTPDGSTEELRNQLAELRELLAQKVLLINELQGQTDDMTSDTSELSLLDRKDSASSDYSRPLPPIVEEKSEPVATSNPSQEAMEEKILTLEKSKMELELIVEKLRSDLAAGIESHEAQESRLQEEIQRLNEHLRDESANLTLSEQKLSEHEDRYRNAVATNATEIERLESESSRLSQDNDGLRSLVEELKMKKDNIERALGESEKQRVELEDMYSILQQQLETSEGKRNELQLALSAEEGMKQHALAEKLALASHIEQMESDGQNENGKVDTLTAIGDQQRHSIEELKTRLASLESDLRTQAGHLERKCEEAIEMQAALSDRDNQLALVQSTLSVKEEKLTETVEAMTQGESDLADMEEQLENMEEALNLKTNELERAKRQLQNTEDQLHTLQQNIDTLTAENESLTSRLTSATSNNERLSSELMSATSDNERLTSELAFAVPENESLTSQLASATSQLDTQQSPLLLAQPYSEDAMSAPLDHSDESLEGLTDELKEMRSELKEKEKLIRELKAANSSLKHTVSVYGDLHSLDAQVFPKRVMHWMSQFIMVIV